jgi:lysophospholipase L1-like esterase
VAGIPYPRANPADADRLPVDVWAAAQLPAGVRIELVGDAQAVQIAYETTSGNLGYRGEGAGCTFAVYRHAQKLCEEEAVLGEGIVELELSGDPDRPAVIYLPEGMRPVVQTVTGVGGTVEPAPTQPRWLAYGDATTQGWLASSPSMSWPAVAARKLGFDVVNLGYAGSARGDTALAEMLADTPAEAISIALGSNAWSRIPHTAELMAEEIRAFVALVRGAQPEVPIVVVSPTLRPDAEDKPNRLGATMADLRIAMEEAVRERMAGGDSRLFLVEGARVLEVEDLEDGVYPGDEGHKRLAAAVSKFLSPIMNDLREAALARWTDESFATEENVPAAAPAPSSETVVDAQTQAVVDEVFAEARLTEAEHAVPAAETPLADVAASLDQPAVGSPAEVRTPEAPPRVVVPSMAARRAAAEAAGGQPSTPIRVTVPRGLVEQLEGPVGGVKYQEASAIAAGTVPAHTPVTAGPDAEAAAYGTVAGAPRTLPPQAGGAEVQPVHAQLAATDQPVAAGSADGPGFVVPQA